MQLRRLTALTTAIIVLAGAAIGAQAQKAGDSWAPDGNVEFVVGAGAGGENDRIARAIQHALTKEHLVDSMTVLNRPGAAQTIAINYLARKKGDANAIGLASGSFINAIARSGSTLHKNVTPLMKLFDAYQCYFARIDSPIKNHGRCARSAAGRSDLGDVRIPGRPWQPAACVRGQCRQGGRRGAEQDHYRGLQFGRRRFRVRSPADTSMSASPASAARCRSLRPESFACSELPRPNGSTARWRTTPRCASRAWMSSPPIPTPCWFRTGLRPSRSRSGRARSTRSSWTGFQARSRAQFLGAQAHQIPRDREVVAGRLRREQGHPEGAWE